ncbi:MAG: HEAT repeat domain-containing protein [Thermacetogeniaceae bacterium]
MRLFRPNIQKMMKKKDVNGLIRAIGDTERYIRLAAIEALGTIGDARAVEPLIAALKDNSWGVRQYAATALGAIGDTRAVKPLTTAFRDSKKIVRKAAAEALAKIGLSVDPEAQAWYLVALEEWSRVIALGEAAIEPLMIALKEGEVCAANALGEIASVRALEPLSAALKEDDYYMRKAAAAAISKIGLPPDPEAQAWYAVEIGDWDRVDILGLVAVEPLIFKLTKYKDIGKGHTARNAAIRLQALYRSGELSDTDKQKILSVCSIMTKPHMDHSEVFDEDPDMAEHEDYGIGVEL